MSGSGQILFGDTYTLDHVLTHTGINTGRNLIIDTLRKIFSREKEWHYVKDIFGFPKTPSALEMDPEAGILDDQTTRIFIGATYRYDISFLPAITVKPVNITYKPVSFNQENSSIKYGIQKLVDGYGNEEFIKVPTAVIHAG